MLRSTKEIIDYKILALDGEIGKVADFYLEEEAWTIRYLVVDLGFWILGRKVLLSPAALGKPDWSSQVFPVTLSKDQIEKSPDIDTHKPISRAHEISLGNYYRWPFYWSQLHSMAAAPIVSPIAVKESDVDRQDERAEIEPDPDESAQYKLRSFLELVNYQVDGLDGSLGQVHDFIVDDDTWIIRYLVLDADELARNKKILISPLWLRSVSYQEESVQIDLSQDSVIHSPDFDPEKPIQRKYEEIIYDYHGRPYYWVKR
jgi:hypothetical protein